MSYVGTTCKAEWNSRLYESLERTFKRYPDAYLTALEQEWEKMFC